MYLGSVGWVHPEWQGDFYPEDMPEDWQLAFYNSQFRCVYLPFEQWRKSSDAEIKNWLQEAREGFVFVLQKADDSDDETSRLAQCFGAKGIFSDQIELVWLEEETDMRQLAQRMQKSVQSGIPLFLIARDSSLTHMRQVKELMDVVGV